MVLKKISASIGVSWVSSSYVLAYHQRNEPLRRFHAGRQQDAARSFPLGTQSHTLARPTEKAANFGNDAVDHLIQELRIHRQAQDLACRAFGYSKP